MKADSHSIIRLHELHIREDGGQYIVEHAAAGTFFEMPPICVEAIRLLESGCSPEDAERALIQAYPAEDVDMADFVEQLLEYGFVKEINGVQLSPTIAKGRKRGNEWIPQGLGRLFFNRFSLILYGLLFAANLVLLAAKPYILPGYAELFVFRSTVINMIVWMAVSLALVLIHECGHLLAVRAKGLPAQVGIGRRLVLIVLETEMTAIFGLPKRSRFVPLLAGLCFDTVMLFAALSARYFGDGSLSATGKGLLGIVVYSVVLTMIYQCLFYMKTDLYYVVEQATGSYNLLESSRAWLRGKLPFLRNNHNKPDGETIKSTVKAYAIFYVAGIGISLAVLITYVIPQLLLACRRSYERLQEPWTSVYFWDGTVFFLQLLLFGFLYIRAVRKEKQADAVYIS